jgi:hypothetical protein
MKTTTRPRLGTLLMIALFVVVLVVGGVLMTGLVISSNARHRAELAQCGRVQVLRNEVNRNSAIEYLVLMTAAEGLKATNPTRARRYFALASATRYASATNCPQAVDHAGSYRAPAPVPYTTAHALRVVLTVGK